LILLAASIVSFGKTENVICAEGNACPQMVEASTQVQDAVNKCDTLKMGQEYGRDSSISGRSLPKRLFIPKKAWGLGLQASYFGGNSSDSQFFQILTGLSGKASLVRIVPYVSYCWRNNQEAGLKIGYTNINMGVDNATINLMSEGMSFNLSGVNLNVNKVGATLFHRSYFGLDRNGVVALFAEFDLGYSHTWTTNGSNGKLWMDYAGLAFCPGVEVFVINNLSLQLLLGLADVGYSWSTSLDSKGSYGYYNSLKAQARVNLSDLYFGLTYYF